MPIYQFKPYKSGNNYHDRDLKYRGAKARA